MRIYAVTHARHFLIEQFAVMRPRSVRSRTRSNTDTGVAIAPKRKRIIIVVAVSHFYDGRSPYACVFVVPIQRVVVSVEHASNPRPIHKVFASENRSSVVQYPFVAHFALSVGAVHIKVTALVVAQNVGVCDGYEILRTVLFIELQGIGVMRIGIRPIIIIGFIGGIGGIIRVAVISG